MYKADYLIEKLGLTKHPEGGYYKEMYRSEETVPGHALPKRYNGARTFATSIYFLLKGDQFSSFHKIQSDETWHFYEGSTLELYILNEKSKIKRHLLGRDLENREQLQVTVPRNHWFGARVLDTESFALLGCSVAPGFHFDDFELAERKNLLEQFPQHEKIIKELTFQ
jgi:predicted cupin superfamily sugar epimerase